MKKMLLVLSMIGLLASSAVAYPGPDSFGVYLETEFVGYPDTCVEAVFLDHVILWLMITDISNTQVKAWEALVTISNEAAWVGNWLLAGGSNYATPPQFVVGAGAAPLYPNVVNAVPLMSIDLLILDVTNPIEVFVAGVPGSLSFPYGPGYAWEAGFPVPCFTSTGGAATPVFRVNGDCLVSDEASSWGDVKTLYK
ncbi:hypothetical protein H8E07_08370 [bacterium]|nr:hypothetical protein [bacterium]